MWALLAVAHAAHGELTTAEEALEEAVAMVDATPDERLTDAAYYLGFAEYMCERDEDAIRHLRRAATHGPVRTADAGRPRARAGASGRLAEARDVAERAVELARGNDQMRSWALGAGGLHRGVMGDRERAVAAAEEAVTIAVGLDTSFFTIAAHALAAAIFLEAGQPERCLEQARLAGSRLDRGRAASLLVMQAYAEAALGRMVAALELLARAQAKVERLPLQFPQGMVRNALARFALESGDHARAAELAAVDSPFPLHAAEAHLIRGRALGAAADLTAAQAVPGAVRLHDEAARELRRLGRVTPGRQRRLGRGELSGREREIAELVAQGFRNREIATELFLSEKTVEGHMTNIFAKLGVSSRAALAARHVGAATA